jgi:hypothetical protein
VAVCVGVAEGGSAVGCGVAVGVGTAQAARSTTSNRQ